MKRLAAALSALVLAAAAHAAPAPWWSAYDEPALDQVMHDAQGVDTGAQQALVQSWIVARVQQARVALLNELIKAARAEQALLMNAEPGPARDPALAAVGQRLDQAETALAGLRQERDAHTDRLAQATGIPADDLTRRLAPPKGRALPQVAQPLPEVGEPAPPLAALSREAARLQQLQRARQLELQAQQAREQAGAGDELATLETFQQLMVDTDRMAVAAGKLALAWAEWLPAKGGR